MASARARAWEGAAMIELIAGLGDDVVGFDAKAWVSG
jgi:hypothetical protein